MHQVHEVPRNIAHASGLNLPRLENETPRSGEITTRSSPAIFHLVTPSLCHLVIVIQIPSEAGRAKRIHFPFFRRAIFAFSSALGVT